MPRLVLLRHGQSEWNLQNRFTGWTDVDLTEAGVTEALEAGEALREAGFRFDRAYTSYLKRAIRTLDLALYRLDRMWIPVEKTWRLNERHYGALQGLDKAETAAKYGDEQVFTWRRSFDTPPPALESGDPRLPDDDPRYTSLAPDQLPHTESLKDTIARVLPYWNSEITSTLEAGEEILVAAHGNSLRALVKHIDGISDADIPGFEIPTGRPLVYELDDSLRPVRRAYIDKY